MRSPSLDSGESNKENLAGPTAKQPRKEKGKGKGKGRVVESESDEEMEDVNQSRGNGVNGDDEDDAMDEEELDKDLYDPTQDKEGKREVRKEYRDAIQAAEGMCAPLARI
jgi:hypothetical protein